MPGSKAPLQIQNPVHHLGDVKRQKKERNRWGEREMGRWGDREIVNKEIRESGDQELRIKNQEFLSSLLLNREVNRSR